MVQRVGVLNRSDDDLVGDSSKAWWHLFFSLLVLEPLNEIEEQQCLT